MEVKVYNQEGKETGTRKVSEKLFGFSWNPELVRESFRIESLNRRRSRAHTKNRSEVSGGGRKPWRQKGTGRARHGSIRSPLWIGGGVTHGPRSEKIYKRKINKKARRKALLTMLSQKLRDREILFLDDLKIPEGRTKKGAEVLGKLSKISGFEKLDPKASVLLLLEPKDAATRKSFRNINNLTLGEARNLNLPELLSHKFLILSQAASQVLEKKF